MHGISTYSALLVLAAGLLAGCSATRITHIDYGQAYRLGELAAASGAGPVAVETQGSAFGLSGSRLAALVATAMPTGLGANARFAPGEPGARPFYHVVWSFAPQPTGLAGDLCGGYAEGAPAPGPGLGVYAAFCRGVTPLSSAFGRLDTVTGPGDPAFRSLIQNVSVALFPTRNPMWDGSDVLEARRR